jgi:WD40 repeat protein
LIAVNCFAEAFMDTRSRRFLNSLNFTALGLASVITLLSPIQPAFPQEARPPAAAKSGKAKGRPLVAPAAQAAVGGESTEFLTPAETIVAPTRLAWCSPLSPDGTWIATGYGSWSGEGQVRAWDLATGQPRWQVRESRGVRAVAISPDGLLVAAANFNGEIKLRDAATGKVRHEFREIRGAIDRICFSSDGRQLATANNQNLVRLWDVATGRILRTFAGHTGGVYWVEFSQDDKLLLSASKDRTVRLWDVASGSMKRMLPHPGEVASAIFLPDGKRLATVCQDGRARIYGVETGELLAGRLAGCSPDRFPRQLP